MGISIERISKQSLILFSIVVMLLGLLVSRALLSIGMISFLTFTCLHKNFFRQLRTFFSTPFLVAISLLFFIPFISGLWSHDVQEWMIRTRIKLPLFLLPLAFAGNWKLSHKQWNRIAYFFLVLIFAGCCWSLYQYLGNFSVIHNEYLKAKMIPTPLENDHVRFSWLVCMAVVTCVLIFKKAKEKMWRIVLGVLMVFFIIYLHVLAARTGLLSFYIFLLFFVLHLIQSAKPKQVVVVCSLLVLLPVAAWWLLPTFQNRLRYNVYDFSFVAKQTYLPGANDGNRMLSLKAGWAVLNEHPLGVGVGDVIHETNEWYTAHVPNMLESDKIYPSSEWLFYGGAAGWAGFVLFTAIMLTPLFVKTKTFRFFWIALNVLAAFSFLFDIGLEVQFGVFIYAFLVLWWWKWFNYESSVDEAASDNRILL